MDGISPIAARRALAVSVITMVLCIMLGIAAWIRRGHLYDEQILAAAGHDVPPGLVASMIWKESRFDPGALGNAGEIGLMQVTEGAAADWARANRIESFDPSLLWHPATNITVGTWYFARAVHFWDERRCSDPFPFALAEYNAGRENAQKWFELSGPDADAFIEAVEFSTTRDYIRDILARYRQQKRKG
jgi:soluble lytic murein transglycosylase